MANKRSFAANQNQHFLANCTGIIKFKLERVLGNKVST